MGIVVVTTVRTLPVSCVRVGFSYFYFFVFDDLNVVDLCDGVFSTASFAVLPPVGHVDGVAPEQFFDVKCHAVCVELLFCHFFG